MAGVQTCAPPISNPGATPGRPQWCAFARLPSMGSCYCDIAPGHPLHGPYHDREYGFRQRDECVLFERLVLAITQAGLSWEQILTNRDAFRPPYDAIGRTSCRESVFRYV